MFTSDARLKTDIKDLAGCLAKIKALRPVEFHWQGNSDDFKDQGFVAQEFYRIFPDWTMNTDDGIKGISTQQPWQIDTSVLLPNLVGAIIELSAILDAIINPPL